VIRRAGFALLPALLFSCATPSRNVGLIPVPLEQENEPVVCRVTRVVGNSPAQAAGIEAGDEVREIDGKRFAGVADFLDALDAAPDAARVVVARAGRERELEVRLGSRPARLGVICDMAGVQDVAEDHEGRHFVHENRRGVTVFVNAERVRGIVFARVGVINRTQKPVRVAPDGFTASDAGGLALSRLTPAEAMTALHGEDAARVMASEARSAHAAFTAREAGEEELSTALSSNAYRAWSLSPLLAAGGNTAARLDADYLLSNSLAPFDLEPGFVISGAMYFALPDRYPLKIRATVGGEKFEFDFEERAP
jgi:hypothetical protein